jgi:hypothetical protein
VNVGGVWSASSVFGHRTSSCRRARGADGWRQYGENASPGIAVRGWRVVCRVGWSGTLGAGTKKPPQAVYAVEVGHSTQDSSGILRSLMGPYRAPAMNLLKSPASRRVFLCQRVGDAMNPRQMRRDEFRYRFGLFAPQDFVERGARNRLVDCHDDRLDPAFRGFRGTSGDSRLEQVFRPWDCGDSRLRRRRPATSCGM